MKVIQKVNLPQSVCRGINFCGIRFLVYGLFVNLAIADFFIGLSYSDKFCVGDRCPAPAGGIWMVLKG